MYKKILFGSFIAVFIAGGIYWYMYFQDVKAPISDAINCIPENAALIIESKQSKNTWKKLSQTNIMWEELLTSQVFYEMDAAANRIDSILDANPGISKLLDGQSVYISAHSISNNSYHFLFTYSLPNLTHQAEIEDLMMKLNKGEKPAYRAFDNYKIGTLKTSASNFLNFCLINGTMLLSSDELLVQEAVKQVNSGKSLIQNAHFKAILNSSGKNVDANIFLNYKLFPSILKNFTNVSISDEIAAFSNFAQYSGWDVSIKPNALMLNGFTYVNDSSNNYLKLFRNQKPQNIEVINVAPSKTAMMLFCGISNFKAYLNDYKLYKKETAQTAIEGFNEKYNANIGTIFSDWFDNEMALIITESNAADFREHAFAYLHSNDVTEAMLALNALADSVSINDSIKTDTLTFKNHFINKISITGFLPHLLGWQFNKIEANYFTSVDNYIVFGNSIASLQTIINDFENSKTLANNKNYIAFAENISNQANVYFYSSMSKSSSFYSSFLNDEQAQNLRAKNELLKKFEAVAFQFSSGEKLFYSNGYIKYNPAYKKEVETIWETKLDTTISVPPNILVNHNTKAKEIFVQDDANKIYLISNTGKILWTKQLSEKIISEVVQIDVLKNNKLQLLFNTASAIYLFDRNGNEMKGFPIQLKSPATNGVSVFDYEKNREYRMFVATADKKISCYKTSGEQVKAFKFDKTNEPVFLPIQFTEIDGKDHLFAVDVKGKIYVMNRQGETKVKLKEKLPPGISHFDIEAGKDYSKTYLIAADTLGMITKLSLSNDKERIKFQDFETSPYFIHIDLNNDKIKEFVFLTRNELKVFNHDKSLLFNYSFSANTNQVPLCYTFPDGSIKIGVVLNETGEQYLINSNGSLYNESPLKGKTHFIVTDLNNDGSFNLITGSENSSVYVYHLE